MRYKLLGKSGLRVSELCLGTMTFGEEWGWGASKEESRKMFDAFAESGGNFIDTANHYTNGTSEKFLGEFIAANRAHFVLATKYSLNQRPDDPDTDCCRECGETKVIRDNRPPTSVLTQPHRFECRL